MQVVPEAPRKSPLFKFSIAVILVFILAMVFAVIVSYPRISRAEFDAQSELLDVSHEAAQIKLLELNKRLVEEMVRTREESEASKPLWADHPEVFERIQAKTRFIKAAAVRQSACADKLTEFRLIWANANQTREQQLLDKATELFDEAENLLNEIEREFSEPQPAPKKKGELI